MDGDPGIGIDDGNLKPGQGILDPGIAFTDDGVGTPVIRRDRALMERGGQKEHLGQLFLVEFPIRLHSGEHVFIHHRIQIEIVSGIHQFVEEGAFFHIQLLQFRIPMRSFPDRLHG